MVNSFEDIRQPEEAVQQACSSIDAAAAARKQPYESTLDVRANPRDLRPIVNEIIRAENWLLDRMPVGQKLVILMPENHAMTTHIALQQAILAAHVKQNQKRQACNQQPRNFALGYETNHNYYPAEIANNSQALLSQFLKDDHPMYSVPQRKRLMKFFLDHDINVQFNDIASKAGFYGNIIDQKDRFTRDIIKQHAPEYLNKNIIRSSSDEDCSLGAKLSNLAMVEKAKAHIEKTEADIYFQQCGLFHALGYASLNYYSYEDSLTAVFKNAGFEVLSYIPSAEIFAIDLPKTAFHDANNIIQINNIDVSKASSIDLWNDINIQSAGALDNIPKLNAKL